VCRLDIVGVIVSPGSAHSLRISVIGYHIVVIGEWLMANGADSALFDYFPL
jgi:hypothetical protein